jgi:hypothetical protein
VGGRRRSDTPMGYGVIGNTADSGSVVLGSSPSTPANPDRKAPDLEQDIIFDNVLSAAQ